MSRIVPQDHTVTGVDEQNPWLGLVSFSEELQPYFFGRDEETDELFRRVVRKNLTVLFGQSGLGKSSLLKAGLFPALREAGYLPIPIRLDHAPTAPSLAEQVIVSIEKSLRDVGACYESQHEANESVWQFLHRRGFQPLTPDGAPIQLVLVFDQFEEIFAVGQLNESSRTRASQFVTELSDLVENRVPDQLEHAMESSPQLVRQYSLDEGEHHFLICLREDYLPHLESLRQAMPSLIENRMRLTRMNGQCALQAVVRPGKQLITEDVGKQIVIFVSGGRQRLTDAASDEANELLAYEVEPSLLSLVCRELNNRRLAAGLPQITTDLLAGSRESILSDFYERCVADQPEAVRKFVEDELVTDSGLRENIALERAQKTLAQSQVPAEVIDQLVQRRLLHVEERLDIQRVELTHDVLTSVVKKSRDERLAREEKLAAQQQVAEQQRQARKQRRRLQFIVGSMALALAIVGFFGVSSYRLYKTSQERLLEVERQKERAEKSEQAATVAGKKSAAVKEVFDAATTPVTEENVRHLPDLGAVHEELVRIRVQSLELLQEKMPDDASVLPELAGAYALLGNIRTHLGKFAKAGDDLQKAAHMYGLLCEKNPNERKFQFGKLRAFKDLSYLFFDDSQKTKAREYGEIALAGLEQQYQTFPEDAEAIYELGHMLVRYGGTLPDGMSKDDALKIALRGKTLCEKALSMGYRTLDSTAAIAVANHRVYVSTTYSPEEDKAASLAIGEFDQKLIELAPTSPYLSGFRLIDMREIDARFAQTWGARLEVRQKAADLARGYVNENQGLARVHSLYIQALDDLANAYRITGDLPSAKQTYLEATSSLEDALMRFPARASTIEQWLGILNSFVSLLELMAENNSNPIRARQELLAIADTAARFGKSKADDFAAHYLLQDKLVLALDNWARLLQSSGSRAESLAVYREAADIARDRILPNPDGDTALKNFRYLSCLDSITRIALELQNGDAIEKAVQEVLAIGKKELARRELNLIATVISRSGEHAQKNGEHQLAIERFHLAIELRKPLFEAANWHWYIRTGLGDDYQKMADSYAAAQRTQEEVQALREYLQLITGPLWGAKVDQLIDPNRQPDAGLATEMREAIDKAQTGMKRFTVPCFVAGVKYPFQVYVTNVPRPKHPLADQARVMLEENSAEIPEEVMSAFERLSKIADENKVSFPDLCVYALSYDDGKKSEIAALLPSKPVDVDRVGARVADDPTAELKSKLIELLDQLKRDASNVELMQKVAEQYVATAKEIGSTQAYSSVRALDGVIGLLQEAVKLRAQVIGLQPTLISNRTALSQVLGELAAAYFAKGDFDSARYRLFERKHLLEQTEPLASAEAYAEFEPGETSKDEINSELGKTYLLFGEVAEATNDLPDALQWYAEAYDKKIKNAVGKLTLILNKNPFIAMFLPTEYQDAYTQARKETTGDLLPGKFTDAIDAQKKALENAKRVAEEEGNADRMVGLKGRIYEKIEQLKSDSDSQGDASVKGWTEVYDLLRQTNRLARQIRSEEKILEQQGPVAAALASAYEALGNPTESANWLRVASEHNHYESMVKLLAIYKAGTPLTADADTISNLEEEIRHEQQLREWPPQLAAAQDRAQETLQQAQIAKNANNVPEYQSKLIETSDLLLFADFLGAYVTPTSDPMDQRKQVIELLVRSFENQGDTKKAAQWQRLATGDGEVESLFRLLDLITSKKVSTTIPEFELDLTYRAYSQRAEVNMANEKWTDAVIDIEHVIKIEPTSYQYCNLGYCYGKMRKWRESAAAYINSIKADNFEPSATDAALSLFDALILQDDPQQVLSAAASLKKRGFKVDNPTSTNLLNTALYHAYLAMAQIMLRQDSQQNVSAMQTATNSSDYSSAWDMTDLKNWLKDHKNLSASQRQAISDIISELEKK